MDGLVLRNVYMHFICTICHLSPPTYSGTEHCTLPLFSDVLMCGDEVIKVFSFVVVVFFKSAAHNGDGNGHQQKCFAATFQATAALSGWATAVMKHCIGQYF